IVKFVVIAIAFAVVITWVFNNTKGSLLMAILVHASIDTFTMPMAAVLSPSEMATSILVWFWSVGAGGRRFDSRPPGLPTLPTRRKTRSGCDPNLRKFRHALTRSLAEKAWLPRTARRNYAAKVTPLKRELVIGCL